MLYFTQYKLKASRSHQVSVFSFLMLIAAMGCFTEAHAQLNTFQSAYFLNQYQVNPAFAGLEKGLRLNMGLQQQFNPLPGGPKLQEYTADYYAGDKVGLGLNISNNSAGLSRRTRVMGTYAYHITLNEEDKLSFGVSVGINDAFIDPSAINGDQSDISIQNYNQRPIYIDGDFGFAYSRHGFTIQAAVPNLHSVFFKQKNENLEVDRATFFTAASYRIPLSTEFSLEPKLVYRGVKGSTTLFDAGFNFVMSDYHLNISGMYHTNQSASLGLGVDLQNFAFLLAYTNNTGPLKTYLSNTFEVGLQLKLFRNN